MHVLAAQGGKHNMSSDGASNYHDYTIDWQPDRLNWEIDGKVVRTLRREDTIDQNSGIYKYPSTPSRVQFRFVARFVSYTRWQLILCLQHLARWHRRVCSRYRRVGRWHD